MASMHDYNNKFMHEYNNSFTKADKEFVDTILSFLRDNGKYSMMEISKKTKLSKTVVSLSVEELLSKKMIECVVVKNKKYYKLIAENAK